MQHTLKNNDFIIPEYSVALFWVQQYIHIQWSGVIDSSAESALMIAPGNGGEKGQC